MSARTLGLTRQCPRQSAQRRSVRRSRPQSRATRIPVRSHAMTRSGAPLLAAPQLDRSASTPVRSWHPRWPGGSCRFRSAVPRARQWEGPTPEAPTTSPLGRCRHRRPGTTRPLSQRPSRQATPPRVSGRPTGRGVESIGDTPVVRVESGLPSTLCCTPRSHRRKSARLTLGRTVERAESHV
jgi:hypothetical protein